MNIIKVSFDAFGKVTETVVAQDLPVMVAKVRAKSLNDSRDTGSEDIDETGLVSYIVRS